MSHITEGASTPSRPQEPDPFRFGWRLVPKVLPNGKPDYDQVPLTLEDLLHPDESCVIVQNTPHQRDRVYLFSVLAHRLENVEDAKVFDDLQIQWDVPGLRAHSPDLSVFYDLFDPGAERTSFDVALEGVRPTVLLEIVSPDYRENDVVTKVEHYERAQVPYYVIVDRLRLEGPVSVIGKRYTPDGFVDMELDDAGRLWLEPLRLWIGTGDNRVVCFDENGREVGDYNKIAAEMEEAERAAEEAHLQRLKAERRSRRDRRAKAKAEEQKAAADRQRAEADRQRNEADRRRSEAERQRNEADRLRAEAERLRAEADRQRNEAEQRAAQKAKERAELEERFRLLQEEMHRLRGSASSD